MSEKEQNSESELAQADLLPASDELAVMTARVSDLQGRLKALESKVAALERWTYPEDPRVKADRLERERREYNAGLLKANPPAPLMAMTEDEKSAAEWGWWQSPEGQKKAAENREGERLRQQEIDAANAVLRERSREQADKERRAEVAREREEWLRSKRA
jgi:hypothetical protein